MRKNFVSEFSLVVFLSFLFSVFAMYNSGYELFASFPAFIVTIVTETQQGEEL
jgi:hypothetical protein